MTDFDSQNEVNKMITFLEEEGFANEEEHIFLKKYSNCSVDITLFDHSISSTSLNSSLLVDTAYEEYLVSAFFDGYEKLIWFYENILSVLVPNLYSIVGPVESGDVPIKRLNYGFIHYGQITFVFQQKPQKMVKIKNDNIEIVNPKKMKTILDYLASVNPKKYAIYRSY